MFTKTKVPWVTDWTKEFLWLLAAQKHVAPHFSSRMATELFSTTVRFTDIKYDDHATAHERMEALLRLAQSIPECLYLPDSVKVMEKQGSDTITLEMKIRRIKFLEGKMFYKTETPDVTDWTGEFLQVLQTRDDVILTTRTGEGFTKLYIRQPLGVQGVMSDAKAASIARCLELLVEKIPPCFCYIASVKVLGSIIGAGDHITLEMDIRRTKFLED